MEEKMNRDDIHDIVCLLIDGFNEITMTPKASAYPPVASYYRGLQYVCVFLANYTPKKRIKELWNIYYILKYQGTLSPQYREEFDKMAYKLKEILKRGE